LKSLARQAVNFLKNLGENYPEVPWKSIIGLRNVLIHDYFGVDVKAVWENVKQRLPELKQQIKITDRERIKDLSYDISRPPQSTSHTFYHPSPYLASFIPCPTKPHGVGGRTSAIDMMFTLPIRELKKG